MTQIKENSIQPRVLRHKRAPAYLGMGERVFNQEIRPYVTEIHIGKRGIGYDRLDLDNAFDHYKNQNGRPGQKEGGIVWDEKERRDFSKEEKFGGLTKPYVESKSDNQQSAKTLKKPKKFSKSKLKQSANQKSLGNDPKGRLLRRLSNMSRNRTMHEAS